MVSPGKKCGVLPERPMEPQVKGGVRFWRWGELSEEGLGQVRCRFLVSGRGEADSRGVLWGWVSGFEPVGDIGCDGRAGAGGRMPNGYPVTAVFDLREFFSTDCRRYRVTLLGKAGCQRVKLARYLNEGAGTCGLRTDGSFSCCGYDTRITTPRLDE